MLHNCDGKARSYYVHRLVLEAFVGPCPEGMEARHFPDRDPTNNCVWNLGWGTHTQNMADREQHGTKLEGGNHPSTKLTHQQRCLLVKLKKRGLSFNRLAGKFSVSVHTIIRQWKRYAKIGYVD